MRAAGAAALSIALLVGCAPQGAPTPTPRPTAAPHVGRHAFVAAIPGFQLEDWRSMLEALEGERREAHWLTYQTAGISTELVWLQRHPRLGPFSITYHEGVEPWKLLERLMASQDPHARWFLNQLGAVHGVKEAGASNEVLLDRTIPGVDEVRTRYAHAFPVAGDGIERLRAAMREIDGPRLAAYEASRQRMGVAREIAWLQLGPTGSYSIYYYELRDVDELLLQLSSSDEPFDAWLGEMYEQIYNMDWDGRIPQANEAVVE